MTTPPPSYAADVVLREGSTVHLRAARPEDRDGLQALLSGLAQDTLHARFVGVLMSTLAGAGQVAPPAGPDQLVLIGEVDGQICAVASYQRDRADAQRAEVAFATADALQGQGIGTRMLECLADIARRQDLRAFEAHVLASNDRMLAVFHDSGFEVDCRLEGGVMRVVLSITETPRFQRKSAERSQVAATASMKRFFEPRSVAIVGANRDRGRIGSEVLHNVIAGGFTGSIAAVHPSATSIDGVPAYPRVLDIPGPVDLAVLCVPASEVSSVVRDCITKDVHALVIISAGFGETGTAGRAIEAQIVETIRGAGVRMIGPNCMGIINTDPAVRLNATFAPNTAPPGRIAMSTQSGALGLAILDYARQLHIGFSTFVSVGNKADVSSNDLIQYWGTDPNTDVILLYLESFGNPRKFGEIARRVGRRKPIVAVKSGRSRSGARAATSHTGALASSDAIVDALFRQAGVIRTTTLEELFDVAALLAHQPVPRGRRVAILTNAGGPGILAADACEARGLELPELSDASMRDLRSFLPAAAAVSNPVDMIASASAEHYERSLTVLLKEERVDSVLVIFIPPLVTRAEDVAAAVRRAALANPGKTVASIFMSAKGAPPMLAPIPSFAFPESAAVALAHAVNRGAWLQSAGGTIPEFANVDRPAARVVVHNALQRGGGWLLPDECEALLLSAGIPLTPGTVAGSEEEAVALAGRMGYPVVLKAVGPTIVHKTDVGGVALNLAGADAVRLAWRDMATRLGSRLSGGLIQTMVTGGVDMLVGATQDPTFGPVVACAMGGVLAELMGDSAFRLHPLTEQDAAAMVGDLRGARLLRGYRGAPAADEDALRDCLLRVSALVEICPEIQELDINPLRVLEKGARALDARVRVQPQSPAPVTRRISY